MKIVATLLLLLLLSVPALAQGPTPTPAGTCADPIILTCPDSAGTYTVNTTNGSHSYTTPDCIPAVTTGGALVIQTVANGQWFRLQFHNTGAGAIDAQYYDPTCAGFFADAGTQCLGIKNQIAPGDTNGLTRLEDQGHQYIVNAVNTDGTVDLIFDCSAGSPTPTETPTITPTVTPTPTFPAGCCDVTLPNDQSWTCVCNAYVGLGIDLSGTLGHTFIQNQGDCTTLAGALNAGGGATFSAGQCDDQTLGGLASSTCVPDATGTPTVTPTATGPTPTPSVTPIGGSPTPTHTRRPTPTTGPTPPAYPQSWQEWMGFPKPTPPSSAFHQPSRL